MRRETPQRYTQSNPTDSPRPPMTVTEQDRQAFARHVLLNPEHRFIFFTIPKVACTDPKVAHKVDQALHPHAGNRTDYSQPRD